MDSLRKSIADLNYKGAVLQQTKALEAAVDAGAKSVHFTELVHFLTKDLRALCGIDEQVNAIQSQDDSASFLLELGSFLRELGCPYSRLVQGHVSDRLQNRDDCILLLHYLSGELMAARMCPETTDRKRIELKLQESNHAYHLKRMLTAFRFSAPPANLSVQMLFQKLTPTVQKAITNVPAALMSQPALNATLNAKQWDVLLGVQRDLHGEYTIRREMLLQRLDCTVQSFKWSDRMRDRGDEIESVFRAIRDNLLPEPAVSIADVLSARQDIAILEKTSNASVRKNTQSNVNKVMIGQVPDRGGRTSEHEPPPPEMPSWQQRSGPGFMESRGGGNRGGGGRGRGEHTGGGGRNDNYTQRGGGNSQSYQQQNNRGSVTTTNLAPSNYYDMASGRGSGHNSQQQFTSYNRNSGGGGFDSAGAFGNYVHQFEQPKRPKTHDSYQVERSTYADQYVQDSQNNQQYRGGRGDRGGSAGGSRGHRRSNRGTGNYY